MLVWLATTLIPKKDRNQFDNEEIGVIKSKKAWKSDITSNLILFVLGLLAIFTIDFIPVPYVGTISFYFGLYAIIKGPIYSVRALIIYKAYDQIYSPDLIKKIEE